MATLLRTRSVYTVRTPQVFHITTPPDTQTPRASVPTKPNADHDRSRDGGRGKTEVLVYTCSVRQRDERTNTEIE